MSKPTRGARFRRAIVSAYDLNEGDAVLLAEIAGVLDTIDGLAPTKVAELRLQRTLLARLLSQLALPDPGAEPPRSSTAASARGRKAASVRWRRQHGEA